MSGLKDDRVAAAAFYEKYGVHGPKTPEVGHCPTVLWDLSLLLHDLKYTHERTSA